MPKLKTNSGAGKRFKKKPNGTIIHRKAYRSHILTKMAPKRKLQLRENTELAKADEKSAKRLLQGS